MPEPNSKAEYILGVDLGGTKILTGVFDLQLKCVGRTKISTKAERGAGAVIERIAHCIRDAVDECDLNLKNVRGIGIGAPGAVDSESGRVLVAPNLGWENVALKKELEKELDLCVFLENDCHICTLGLYEAEFKSKPRTMVGIFVGTGIGGGVIVDGQLYLGFNGTAGEIGHMVLEAGGPKCSCGNKGCFEALAGRGAIFRKIQTAVKDGQKTLLTDMLGDDLKDLRSGDLRKAIKAGDKFVQRVIEEAAEYIGMAAGSLINVLNPEMVVLGGGIIDALGDQMMPIIHDTAQHYALNKTAGNIEIVASRIADDAGITGGAVLARRATK
jgi:glucokinase